MQTSSFFCLQSGHIYPGLFSIKGLNLHFDTEGWEAGIETAVSERVRKSSLKCHFFLPLKTAHILLTSNAETEAGDKTLKKCHRLPVQRLSFTFRGTSSKTSRCASGSLKMLGGVSLFRKGTPLPFLHCKALWKETYK